MRDNIRISKYVIRVATVVAIAITIPLFDHWHVSHSWGGAIVATEVLFGWFLDTFREHLHRMWLWQVSALLFLGHCALLWIFLSLILPRTASIGNFWWAVLLFPEGIVFQAITREAKARHRLP